MTATLVNTTAQARMLTLWRSLAASSVMRGATSLFATGLLTSVAGVGFWAAATHFSDSTTVGRASAGISLMTLLASFGSLGLGTLLIGELGGQRAPRLHLVSAGILAALVFTLAISALVVSVVVIWPSASGALGGLAGAARVVFVFGTGVTAALLVLDQALVGMGRGGVQLRRNVTFSLAKLLALVVAALVMQLTPAVILLSWIVGAGASLVALAGRRARPDAASLRPDFGSLRGQYRSAAAHHVMNVASHAPMLAMPPIVVAMRGAHQAGIFYIALLVIAVPWSVSSFVATALFGVGRGRTTQLRHELRLAVAVCLAAAVATALLTWCFGAELLSLFGHDYRQAAVVLGILGLVTLPSSAKSLWIASSRVQGRLARAAASASVCAAVEIGAFTAGLTAGTTAAALALLAVTTLECAVFSPALARAARTPGQHSALAAAA